MNQTKQTAEALSGLNWKLFPVHSIDQFGKCTCGTEHSNEKDKGKHPAINSWNENATSDIPTILNWIETRPSLGLGVFCKPSGFFVIDIDPRSGGIESFDKFDEEVGAGALPKTVMAYTGAYTHKGKSVRGRHIFYKVSADESLQGNLNGLGLPGIDIKHNGYVVIPPTKHFSGVSYEWVEGHAPWEVEMAEAPERLLQVLRVGKRKNATTLGHDANWNDLLSVATSGDKVDIAKILEEGIDEGSRAVDVYKLACALANKFGTSSDARMMIETMMIRFNHEKVNPPMELEGPNSLLMHTRRAIDFVAENPFSTVPVEGFESGPNAFNDAAVAEWLAQSLGKSFCWTAHRDWLHFEEGYWKQCPREVVIEFISEYLTRYWIAFKAEVHDSSLVNRVASLLSNQRLKAFESLLRGKLVKEADLFDTKVDFLNVGNGIVNLRTKELLPHSPEWYFTKITPVNYKPNARHVDWLKVLEAIPSPVMEYVHSLLGQALTGRPPLEDVVAVFNGGGRNGKSTVTQVMVIVLGSFAVTVSDKILIARANDHSTDLTDLRGRRFALLEEFPDRVPLNGKRLKDITGTARITARRMRHDNESWAPTHTLVITTNHGIVVEAGDDGTWRRLVPIKFVYRFVKEPKGPLDRQIEEGLRERVYQGLEGQHEAALAWLIDGAFKWYSNGMKLPAQPKESKDELVEWRSGQDTLGTFLGETLEVSPGSVVLVNDLHNLYLAQNPDDLLHRTSAAFTSSLRSHEFFVTNALTTKRMRVNGIQLSRPNGFVIYEGLSPQPTCLIGVAFKN